MWNFPLFPDTASSVAGRVDALYLFELVICVVTFVLVALTMLVFMVRYRRGTKVNRDHPPHTSKVVEAIWITIPLILFMGMFAFSAEVFNKIFQPPADATEVYVVGKQWMWYLQHPEGKREINELHLPVGRAVKLKMTSQDVIHSFFVPAFRVKQDVLPGRYTEMWFKPTKTGKYHLFCTEYCGTSHSAMGGFVYVMTQAEYDDWLASSNESQVSMADEGKKLFVQYHCSGCHGVDSSVSAPRLEGVYGSKVPIQRGEDTGDVYFIDADDRYIRDSILLPKQQVVAGFKPIMPSFQGQIPEDDLLRIIQYVKSIGQEVPQ